METLFRSMVNAAEGFFSGMIGVIDVFGNSNRFLAALFLIIIGFLARKIRGSWGELVSAFFFGAGIYTLLRSMGATEWLSMVASTAVIVFFMWNLVADSFKSKAWFWLLGSSILFATAVMALFSFLSIGLPGGELNRVAAGIGNGFQNFLGNFLDAAQDGARQNQRNNG